MIRITVELVSAIHPSRSRVLGVATITNDGTGTQGTGHYDVAMLNKRGAPYKWRGRVAGYPRQSVSFWHLITMGLRAATLRTELRYDRKKRGGM